MRWGMVIDLDKCVACQSCVVACKVENNTPANTPHRFETDELMWWMQVLPKVKGEFPDVETKFLPRPCMHCEKAPCVDVCPVGATYRRDDGVVVVNYDRCIGCRYCTVACPYGARSFNWTKPELESRAPGGNPAVPIRPVGVVEKCTFCVQRIDAALDAAAKGEKLEDGALKTACTQTCPPSAIKFGDLDDPGSEVARLATSRRASRLLEELGTHPSVYYLSEG